MLSLSILMKDLFNHISSVSIRGGNYDGCKITAYTLIPGEFFESQMDLMLDLENDYGDKAIVIMDCNLFLISLMYAATSVGIHNTSELILSNPLIERVIQEKY